MRPAGLRRRPGARLAEGTVKSRTHHGLRWAADGGTTALPVPHGMESAAALAAAGDWAVGNASRPPSENKDDLAPQGVRWNLRTGAVELISGMSGRRVSASGTVAGTTTSTGAPALWRDGRIFTLPLPPGGAQHSSSMSGITADGHSLVGGVEVPTGPISTSGPDGDPVASDQTVPVVWHGC